MSLFNHCTNRHPIGSLKDRFRKIMVSKRIFYKNISFIYSDKRYTKIQRDIKQLREDIHAVSCTQVVCS